MQSPANGGQMTFLRQPFLNRPDKESAYRALYDRLAAATILAKYRSRRDE